MHCWAAKRRSATFPCTTTSLASGEPGARALLSIRKDIFGGAAAGRRARDSVRGCPSAVKTPSPPPICILAAPGTGIASYGPLGRSQPPPPQPSQPHLHAGPTGACCGPLSVIASHNIGTVCQAMLPARSLNPPTWHPRSTL